MTLGTEALPELRELCQRTNETVHLAVLDDGEVIYIDKEKTQQTIGMFSAIGKRGPAHCTGVGKVLLAHLPPDELLGVLSRKPLRRFTDNTITRTAALREELTRIRQRGYAIATPSMRPTSAVPPVLSATTPAVSSPRLASRRQRSG
jgi:DNA-binding IclR family transcriptional regulator